MIITKTKQFYDTHVEMFAKTLSTYARDYIPECKDFYLKRIVVDWSTHRRSCRGGVYKDGPGINMAMYPIYRQFFNGGVVKVREYASFDNHPVIGGFLSDNILDEFDLAVCHEVAHAIQHFMARKKKVRYLPHGEEFKHYYAILRRKFLNDRIPNQRELVAKYEQLKKEARCHEIHNFPLSKVA